MHVKLSKLNTCSTAAKGFSVPLLEEHSRVGVQEVGEPSNSVSRTVATMVVVPARHLALILIATHVWGDADDGLVDITVTETAVAITGAVLYLVVGLQFEAFITECWLTGCWSFVWVVEGDVVFI